MRASLVPSIRLLLSLPLAHALARTLASPRHPPQQRPVAFAFPASTPVTREALDLCEMRAEEARRAAQKASSDLYAAMAELKQTESPLLNAQQEAKRAAAVVGSAMAALADAQAHFDQEMSRFGSPEVANREAVAAKKDVGESMAKITAASSQAKAHLETCREAWESADAVYKATTVKAAALLDAAAQVGLRGDVRDFFSLPT